MIAQRNRSDNGVLKWNETWGKRSERLVITFKFSCNFGPSCVHLNSEHWSHLRGRGRYWTEHGKEQWLLNSIDFKRENLLPDVRLYFFLISPFLKSPFICCVQSPKIYIKTFKRRRWCPCQMQEYLFYPCDWHRLMESVWIGKILPQPDWAGHCPAWEGERREIELNIPTFNIYWPIFSPVFPLAVTWNVCFAVNVSLCWDGDGVNLEFRQRGLAASKGWQSEGGMARPVAMARQALQLTLHQAGLWSTFAT